MSSPFISLGISSWSEKGFGGRRKKLILRRGASAEPEGDGGGGSPSVAFLEYTTTASTSSFTLRSTGTVDYEVDWGDGTTESLTTTAPTHAYSSAGEYTIKVTPAEGSTYRPYVNQAVFPDTSIASVSGTGGSQLGTTLSDAWEGASNMTSFGSNIDTSSVTNFSKAWSNCRSLTSFPLIDTSSGTFFTSAWQKCDSLTSFPLIDTSNGQYFYYTWGECDSLTSFPLLDTSSGTNFNRTWFQCSGLTSFPSIDTSSGTTFYRAWYGCSSLTTFPLLNVSSVTDFRAAWYECSSLTTFPANMFNTTGTLRSDAFDQCWEGCALSAQSIENILTSLDTNGASNITLGIDDGTNAAKTTWSAAANTAYTNLINKGWTINYNA